MVETDDTTAVTEVAEPEDTDEVESTDLDDEVEDDYTDHDKMEP